MSRYDKVHVQYDELGLKSVHCIVCNTIIAARTYVNMKSRVDPGKTEKVLTVKRWSNWRNKHVELSDGSFMEPMVCEDCERDPLDEELAIGVVKKGWVEEMKAVGRKQKDIDEQMEKVKNLKSKKQKDREDKEKERTRIQ